MSPLTIKKMFVHYVPIRGRKEGCRARGPANAYIQPASMEKTLKE